MGFNSNAGKVSYTVTNASTVEYTFNFKIYVSADLKVYKTLVGTTPDDDNDILVESVDYTVEIDGDVGGYITLLAAPTIGDTLILNREIVVDRSVEYTPNGGIYSANLNDDQNFQSHLIGDQIINSTRNIQLPVTAIDIDTSLPTPEAGSIIRWSDDGTYLINDVAYALDLNEYTADRAVYDADRAVYDNDRIVYNVDRNAYNADRDIYDADRAVYDADRLVFDGKYQPALDAEINALASEVAAAASETAAALSETNAAASEAGVAADAATASTAASNASTSETNAGISETNAAASAAAASISEQSAAAIVATEIAGSTTHLDDVILDIPFRNNLSMKVGNGQIEYFAPTTSTYISSQGRVINAAIDEPRFESEGLLLEGPSTNQLLYSDDFTNAVWTDPLGSTRTIVNDTDSPESLGTNDASAVTLTATTTTFRQAVTYSTYNSVSVWIRPIGGTTSITSVTLSAGGGAPVEFVQDLYQGIDFNDGDWLRMEADSIALGGGSYVDITITAAIGAEFVLWGAQVEQVPWTTSYIPTTTTTASRSHSYARLDVTNNWGMLPSGSSSTIEYNVKNTTLTRHHFYSHSYAAQFAVEFNTWHNAEGVYNRGNYTDSNALSGKHFQTYDGTTLLTYHDGVQKLSFATPHYIYTPPYSDYIYFGRKYNSTSTNNSVDGHIKNFKTYNRVLTPTEVLL